MSSDHSYMILKVFLLYFSLLPSSWTILVCVLSELSTLIYSLIPSWNRPFNDSGQSLEMVPDI